MKFDIYGRKILEVVRSNGEWLALYPGSGGTKRKAEDIVIPEHLSEDELEEYIADVFHEWATPERSEVRRV
ncbi:DUF7661 family protein [Saccharospirillum salsuginis]|uniref:DUF7661 domain-containing protein n=1 Tax=Saccharospirillum salsuginis TaxID=418750 RepID=A0A918K8G2_9GAMM|nr:hypothetical protein [Saccharospirillum salsuginis]GGX53473.1 hypothetical protein GCM10007392_21230 [Saccharospirillum salsuginis]